MAIVSLIVILQTTAVSSSDWKVRRTRRNAVQMCMDRELLRKLAGGGCKSWHQLWLWHAVWSQTNHLASQEIYWFQVKKNIKYRTVFQGQPPEMQVELCAHRHTNACVPVYNLKTEAQINLVNSRELTNYFQWNQVYSFISILIVLQLRLRTGSQELLSLCWWACNWLLW